MHNEPDEAANLMANADDTAKGSGRALAADATHVHRRLRRGRVLAVVIGLACGAVVVGLMLAFGERDPGRVARRAIDAALIISALAFTVTTVTLLKPLRRLAGSETDVERMRRALRKDPIGDMPEDLDLRSRYWVPASTALWRTQTIGLVLLFLALGSSQAMYTGDDLRDLQLIQAGLSLALAGAFVVFLIVGDRRRRRWIVLHPAPGPIP